jgi:hypothetical protein
VGHWWASFVVPALTEALPATGRVIGIDWGVKETATTTSAAYGLPHPQHGRTAAHKLARYQRMMARRRPAKGQAASKGYREAKRQTAKLHRKVAAQRQDTARKWAKKVVREHDALAVEDFRPKFLAKTTMARKAADAAISATKKALVEMARKHGRAVHLVHPAHTTMDCAKCGARTKHALPLSERTYTCTACGAVSPRDKNSARVNQVQPANPASAALAKRHSGPAHRCPSDDQQSRNGVSGLAGLQVANHPDPDAQPRIGVVVEHIVLRLQSNSGGPHLVGGRVGDSAVESPPDPEGTLPGRGRCDRVGPLDRVSALVKGAPR